MSNQPSDNSGSGAFWDWITRRCSIWTISSTRSNASTTAINDEEGEILFESSPFPSDELTGLELEIEEPRALLASRDIRRTLTDSSGFVAPVAQSSAPCHLSRPSISQQEHIDTYDPTASTPSYATTTPRYDFAFSNTGVSATSPEEISPLHLPPPLDSPLPAYPLRRTRRASNLYLSGNIFQRDNEILGDADGDDAYGLLDTPRPSIPHESTQPSPPPAYPDQYYVFRLIPPGPIAELPVLLPTCVTMDVWVSNKPHEAELIVKKDHFLFVQGSMYSGQPDMQNASTVALYDHDHEQGY